MTSNSKNTYTVDISSYSNDNTHDLSIDSIVAAAELPVESVTLSTQGRHINLSVTDSTFVKEKFGG